MDDEIGTGRRSGGQIILGGLAALGLVVAGLTAWSVFAPKVDVGPVPDGTETASVETPAVDPEPSGSATSTGATAPIAAEQPALTGVDKAELETTAPEPSGSDGGVPLGSTVPAPAKEISQAPTARPADTEDAGEPEIEPTARADAETPSPPSKTAEAAVEAATDPAPPVEETTETATDAVPTFDLVRVDAEGGAVVAGRAMPGGAVRILLDGVQVASAVADRRGSFVALFSMAVSSQAQALTLEADGPDGEQVQSVETALVSPLIAEPERTLAQAEPSVAPDTGGRTQPVGEAMASSDPTEEVAPPATIVAQSSEGDPTAGLAAEVGLETRQSAEVEATQPAGQGVEQETDTGQEKVLAALDPALERGVQQSGERLEQERVLLETPAPQIGGSSAGPVPTPPSAVAAVARPTVPQVVIVDGNGARPAAPAAQPDRPGLPGVANVVIDTISYDDQGEVVLVGRAQPDRLVRLYLNNRLVEQSDVTPEGLWRSRLTGIDAGVYTLRADEIGADGSVLSRFETPFERAQRLDALRAAAAQSETAVTNAETTAFRDYAPGARAVAGIVTVQPGFTLWRIARENYGDGFQYVRVFASNRERIRDPDLIYPGQVFTVPGE